MAGKWLKVRLEKTSLVTVIVCMLTVFAVPFFRDIAFSQFKQAMPGHEENPLDGYVDTTVLKPGRKTDTQLLKERPKDFLLRLGLVQEGLHTSIYTKPARIKLTEQVLAELQRDYPKHGAVYVVATEMPDYSRVRVPRRVEGSGITPEEVKRYGRKPEPVTGEQLDGVRRCVELLDKAIAADPDNGWFHCQRAAYLFGLHRDDEALREIQLAAIAPRFSNYTELRAKSLDHLFDLRGNFDPIKRAGKKSLSSYSNLSSVREEARIAAHLAYKEISQGNTDKGIRIALDITDLGYNMATNAPTFIHALVGNAIMPIGTKALDPDFKPKAKDEKAQRVARRSHYNKFLINHGYTREAVLLEAQWRETDKLTGSMRVFYDTKGHDDYQVLLRYASVFTAATRLLVIFLLFAATWAVASLLSRRSSINGFWDRRAAAISSLLYALVFVPVIADLLIPKTETRMERMMELIMDESAKSPYHSSFLLIPLGVAIIALLTGLVVMLRRKPGEGNARCMPAASLLIAYLAAVGGLVYLASGLNYLAESSGLFSSLQDSWSGILTHGPIVAITLYALLRGVQSRMNRAGGSTWLAFIATVRYSSASAACLFAAAYMVMLVLTAHYGIKADAVARGSVMNEASIIRSVFR